MRSSSKSRRARAAARRAALRLALLTLAVGVLLGLLVPNLFAADRDSPSGRVRIHVVSNGETLWSLAERAPGDPREFVHDVQVLNGLESPRIFPGQRIVLPPR